MTCICPTCHRPMNAGRAPIEGLASAPLGNLERRLVEAMVQAYPRSLTKNYLIEFLYSDDPDGGPESVGSILAVMMTRLRKKLPAYGWTIPLNTRGAGNYGRYRLEPLP